jgi:hypothetical protein
MERSGFGSAALVPLRATCRRQRRGYRSSCAPSAHGVPSCKSPMSRAAWVATAGGRRRSPLGRGTRGGIRPAAASSVTDARKNIVRSRRDLGHRTTTAAHRRIVRARAETVPPIRAQRAQDSAFALRRRARARIREGPRRRSRREGGHHQHHGVRMDRDHRRPWRRQGQHRLGRRPGFAPKERMSRTSRVPRRSIGGGAAASGQRKSSCDQESSWSSRSQSSTSKRLSMLAVMWRVSSSPRRAASRSPLRPSSLPSR